MFDTLLSIIAPHHCYLCHKVGAVLCQSCKYDIASDAAVGCVVCGTSTLDGICAACRSSYQKAWCVGVRRDELERCINDYKFERLRAASTTFADLLHLTLPILPDSTIVVPVPTIASHIRQRGYDHSALIAKRFARLRKLPYQPVVARSTNTKQRGASRKQRIEQAKEAFKVTKSLSDGQTYLLVDDVMTTGATMQYAAQALLHAGAKEVWIAIIARQPLDKLRSHLLK